MNLNLYCISLLSQKRLVQQVPLFADHQTLIQFASRPYHPSHRSLVTLVEVTKMFIKNKEIMNKSAVLVEIILSKRFGPSPSSVELPVR